jgi:cytochrome c oxidase assembly factor CtaG
MLFQTSSPTTFGWDFAPSIMAMLFSQAALYGYLIYLARKDGHWGQDVKLRHIAWFTAGLLTIFIALVSPLDALSNSTSLGAHMVQHILLAIVAPALLLLGTPDYWIRYLFTLPVIKHVLRFIAHPLIAFAIFNVVLWAWHLPVLYEGALRDPNVHILEHTMFMVIGVIMWAPILFRLPPDAPMGYLAKITYLFFNMISSSILAAIFTFAQNVIYPFYGNAMQVFGMTPLDDQQLAGAIMWVPGGGIFLIATLIAFAAWLQNEERKGQAKYPPPPYVT